MSNAGLHKDRFEYGRHETFAIRHGWLCKGLGRMEASPTGFHADEDAVVGLGLGSRMVKSLRYWLEASGIGIMRPAESGARAARELHTSPLGHVIAERDPYMEYPATWWFVHLMLARRYTSVWGWFFNDYRDRVFERPAAIDAYVRHLKLYAANETTMPVAQRDVACLLAAYASGSVEVRRDPEDGTASPLRELGLILRQDDTGRFERTRPLDGVPLEAFLACAAAQAEDLDLESLSMGELVGCRGGPGTIMGLSGDAIEELASRAAHDAAEGGVTLDRLGSERRLRVPAMGGAHHWLDRHFRRLENEG